MTTKALKLSDDPKIDYEEILVATPGDVPVIPDEKYGYLHAPSAPDNVMTHTVTASSSSNAFGRSPSSAVDGSTSSFWSSANGFPQWAQFDLDKPYRVLSWYLCSTKCAEPTKPASDSTSDFKIQYYDTGTSAWVDAVTMAGATADPLSGTFPAPITAQSWRVYITASGTQAWAEIGEFKLFGYDPLPLATRTGDLGGSLATSQVTGMLGYPLYGAPADGAGPVFDAANNRFKFVTGGTNASSIVSIPIVGTPDSTRKFLQYDTNGPRFIFSPITAYKPAPATLPNLALTSTATADSCYGGNCGSYGAGNAINGATTGAEWVSADAAGDHWLQLVLPSYSRISQYVLYFEANPSYVIHDYSFQVWDDSTSNWLTVDSVSGNTTYTLTRSITPVDTSKVRLLVTNPNSTDHAARVYELQVMGYALQAVALTDAYSILGYPISGTPSGTNNTLRFDGTSSSFIFGAAGSGGGGTTINSGTAFPASPATGDLFIRTDTTPPGLYRYDGTAWDLVGDGGGSSGSSGSVGQVVTTGARVHLNTLPTINNGTTPFIFWDTEDADSDGYFDTGQADRFTVPAGLGGIYMVEAQIAWSGASGGQRTLHLFKNGGSTPEATASEGVSDNRIFTSRLSKVLSLAPGDYVQIQVYQDSGNNLAFSSGLSHYWTITRLGENFGGLGGAVVAAKAKITATQAIPQSGANVSFNATDFDTSGFFNATNPTRLTVPAGQGGLYDITAYTEWTANGTDYRIGPQIIINGVIAAKLETGQVSSDPYPSYSVSGKFQLNPGDYVQLKAYYTGTVNESVTAATLSLVKHSGAVAAAFDGASIYATSTQPIPSAATAVLTFDSIAYDTRGFFSSAQPTRLTVPAGMSGKYRVTGSCRFTPNNATRRELFLRRNGSESLVEAETPANTASYVALIATKTLDLVAGDYIELAAYQDGTAITTWVTPPPFLQLELVAPVTTFTTSQLQLQSAYPGTAQTGSAHVSGTLGADTRVSLGTIPMLERGTTFPTTPVDGQRYFNATYRSWFTYYTADAKWRQEAPGVFDGSFPTVATADNTVAPKIRVYRADRTIEYFWNGANWLGPVQERQLTGRNFSNIATAPGAGGFLVLNGQMASDYDWYIEKIVAGFVHFVAQSSTNYYTLTSSISFTGGPYTTQANTTVGSDYTIEPTFTPVVYSKANKVFGVNIQQTGAPGNVEFSAMLRYRLVG